MLLLAYRNLAGRPLRTGLTTMGLVLAVAVLACLSAFGEGYRRSLGTEMDRMGMQLMLVPLGCPYDAAARVLKGRTLEHSLPESAVEAARRDPAVAVAAPLLLASVVREQERRTDLWAGLDRSALALKPWWKAAAGSDWFPDDDSVILGYEAAAVEMRAPGDRFYSPEMKHTFRVAGVLQRSGTSDDSLFFIPLATAQKTFAQPRRLTAIAIRLKDPTLLMGATQRLQQVRGAQVVTLTEMMGVFLNLVGSVRTLLMGIAAVALVASMLCVFNTLLAAVLEQAPELSLMRAIGASRGHLFGLVITEAALLTVLGVAGGLLLAAIAGPGLESLALKFAPLGEGHRLMTLSGAIVMNCLVVGAGVGLASGLYPAWQASRLPPALALRGAE
jgi:putative ABC transport system permease protein